MKISFRGKTCKQSRQNKISKQSPHDFSWEKTEKKTENQGFSKWNIASVNKDRCTLFFFSKACNSFLLSLNAASVSSFSIFTTESVFLSSLRKEHDFRLKVFQLYDRLAFRWSNESYINSLMRKPRGNGSGTNSIRRFLLT